MKAKVVICLSALLFVGCGGNFEVSMSTDNNKSPNLINHEEANTDNTEAGDTNSDGQNSELKSNNCQSDTLCVHSEMPILSQSDGASMGVVVNGQYQIKVIDVNDGSVPLLQYIQNKGYTMTKDPGWCGAVSFAMALKTWAYETKIETNQLSDSYKWMLSSDSSEVIFNIMSLLNMNPNIGVSTPETHLSGFTKLMTLGNSGTVEFSNDLISPTAYRDLKKNPIMTIGMGSRTGGGHLLAINGTDAQYYVINDPWGATYSVTYAKGTIEKSKPDGTKYYDYSFKYIGSGIKLLNGISSGFIPTYSDVNGLIGVSMLVNYRK